MKSQKVLHQDRLIENLSKFKNKKICAMVKANAYGHGLEKIVKMIEKHIDFFGVVNIDEAIAVRRICDKPILICAKVQNYATCLKNNFDVVIDDENDLKDFLKHGLKNNLHLKINCGMNRFGVKSVLNLRMINMLLESENVKLKSICTHFPCTENRAQTLKNYDTFLKLREQITQNTALCFGGSGIYSYPFEFDILRLGIGMYGYGQKGLLPVMSVRSYVSKIFYAKKGEFVGYGKKYCVNRGGLFAVVALGYGDGLRRNLSGKFKVKINGKSYHTVGNICMDAFFVKVDENVSVGDVVEVMTDANYLAKIGDTISYEILTGFSNLRGEILVEK